MKEPMTFSPDHMFEGVVQDLTTLDSELKKLREKLKTTLKDLKTLQRFHKLQKEN